MKDIITAAQAALILGISVQAVHALSTRGSLPYLRMGRYKLFRKAEVEALLNDPKYLNRTRRRLSLQELAERFDGQKRFEV